MFYVVMNTFILVKDSLLIDRHKVTQLNINIIFVVMLFIQNILLIEEIKDNKLLSVSKQMLFLIF